MLEIMESNGEEEFTPKIKRNWSEIIQPEDITSAHVKAGKLHAKRKDYVFKFNKEQAREAAEKANKMMEVVKNETESICTCDNMFEKDHVAKVLRCGNKQIINHNEGEMEKVSFTPVFHAMFLRYISNYIIPKFQEMQLNYEKKHGFKAKLKSFGQRVFRFFKNLVRCAEPETTASEDFMEVLKPTIKDYVDVQLHQKVSRLLRDKLGTSKYDLATTMLETIAMIYMNIFTMPPNLPKLG